MASVEVYLLRNCGFDSEGYIYQATTFRGFLERTNFKCRKKYCPGTIVIFSGEEENTYCGHNHAPYDCIKRFLDAIVSDQDEHMPFAELFNYLKDTSSTNEVNFLNSGSNKWLKDCWNHRDEGFIRFTVRCEKDKSSNIESTDPEFKKRLKELIGKKSYNLNNVYAKLTEEFGAERCKKNYKKSFLALTEEKDTDQHDTDSEEEEKLKTSFKKDASNPTKNLKSYKNEKALDADFQKRLAELLSVEKHSLYDVYTTLCKEFGADICNTKYQQTFISLSKINHTSKGQPNRSRRSRSASRSKIFVEQDRKIEKGRATRSRSVSKSIRSPDRTSGVKRALKHSNDDDDDDLPKRLRTSSESRSRSSGGTPGKSKETAPSSRRSRSVSRRNEVNKNLDDSAKNQNSAIPKSSKGKSENVQSKSKISEDIIDSKKSKQKGSSSRSRSASFRESRRDSEKEENVSKNERGAKYRSRSECRGSKSSSKPDVPLLTRWKEILEESTPQPFVKQFTILEEEYGDEAFKKERTCHELWHLSAGSGTPSAKQLSKKPGRNHGPVAVQEFKAKTLSLITGKTISLFSLSNTLKKEFGLIPWKKYEHIAEALWEKEQQIQREQKAGKKSNTESNVKAKFEDELRNILAGPKKSFDEIVRWLLAKFGVDVYRKNQELTKSMWKVSQSLDSDSEDFSSSDSSEEEYKNIRKSSSHSAKEENKVRQSFDTSSFSSSKEKHKKNPRSSSHSAKEESKKNEERKSTHFLSTSSNRSKEESKKNQIKEEYENIHELTRSMWKVRQSLAGDSEDSSSSDSSEEKYKKNQKSSSHGIKKEPVKTQKSSSLKSKEDKKRQELTRSMWKVRQSLAGDSEDSSSSDGSEENYKKNQKSSSHRAKEERIKNQKSSSLKSKEDKKRQELSRSMWKVDQSLGDDSDDISFSDSFEEEGAKEADSDEEYVPWEETEYFSLKARSGHTKSNLIKSSQVKQTQAKLSQAKSSQSKSAQVTGNVVKQPEDYDSYLPKIQNKLYEILAENHVSFNVLFKKLEGHFGKQVCKYFEKICYLWWEQENLSYQHQQSIIKSAIDEMEKDLRSVSDEDDEYESENDETKPKSSSAKEKQDWLKNESEIVDKKLSSTSNQIKNVKTSKEQQNQARESKKGDVPARENKKTRYEDIQALEDILMGKDEVTLTTSKFEEKKVKNSKQIIEKSSKETPKENHYFAKGRIKDNKTLEDILMGIEETLSTSNFNDNKNKSTKPSNEKSLKETPKEKQNHLQESKREQDLKTKEKNQESKAKTDKTSYVSDEIANTNFANYSSHSEDKSIDNLREQKSEKKLTVTKTPLECVKDPDKDSFQQKFLNFSTNNSSSRVKTGKAKSGTKPKEGNRSKDNTDTPNDTKTQVKRKKEEESDLSNNALPTKLRLFPRTSTKIREDDKSSDISDLFLSDDSETNDGHSVKSRIFRDSGPSSPPSITNGSEEKDGFSAETRKMSIRKRKLEDPIVSSSKKQPKLEKHEQEKKAEKETTPPLKDVNAIPKDQQPKKQISTSNNKISFAKDKVVEAAKEKPNEEIKNRPCLPFTVDIEEQVVGNIVMKPNSTILKDCPTNKNIKKSTVAQDIIEAVAPKAKIVRQEITPDTFKTTKSKSFVVSEGQKAKILESLAQSDEDSIEESFPIPSRMEFVSFEEINVLLREEDKDDFEQPFGKETLVFDEFVSSETGQHLYSCLTFVSPSVIEIVKGLPNDELHFQIDCSYEIQPDHGDKVILVMVNALARKACFPLLWAVASEAHEHCFVLILEQLRSIISNVKRFVIDVSDHVGGMENAIRATYPHSEIMGAWFYFARSLYLKAQQLGLILKSDAVALNLVRLALTISLLPFEQIEKGVEVLTSYIVAKCYIKPATLGFLHYIAELTSSYKEHFSSHLRSYSFNDILKPHVKEFVIAEHSNLWYLVQDLLKMEVMDYGQMKMGNTALEKRCKELLSKGNVQGFMEQKCKDIFNEVSSLIPPFIKIEDELGSMGASDNDLSEEDEKIYKKTTVKNPKSTTIVTEDLSNQKKKETVKKNFNDTQVSNTNKKTSSMEKVVIVEKPRASSKHPILDSIVNPPKKQRANKVLNVKPADAIIEPDVKPKNRTNKSLQIPVDIKSPEESNAIKQLAQRPGISITKQPLQQKKTVQLTRMRPDSHVARQKASTNSNLISFQTSRGPGVYMPLKKSGQDGSISRNVAVIAPNNDLRRDSSKHAQTQKLKAPTKNSISPTKSVSNNSNIMKDIGKIEASIQKIKKTIGLETNESNNIIEFVEEEERCSEDNEIKNEDDDELDETEYEHYEYLEFTTPEEAKPTEDAEDDENIEYQYYESLDQIDSEVGQENEDENLVIEYEYEEPPGIQTQDQPVEVDETFAVDDTANYIQIEEVDDQGRSVLTYLPKPKPDQPKKNTSLAQEAVATVYSRPQDVQKIATVCSKPAAVQKTATVKSRPEQVKKIASVCSRSEEVQKTVKVLPQTASRSSMGNIVKASPKTEKIKILNQTVLGKHEPKFALKRGPHQELQICGVFDQGANTKLIAQPVKSPTPAKTFSNIVSTTSTLPLEKKQDEPVVARSSHERITPDTSRTEFSRSFDAYDLLDVLEGGNVQGSQHQGDAAKIDVLQVLTEDGSIVNFEGNEEFSLITFGDNVPRVVLERDSAEKLNVCGLLSNDVFISPGTQEFQEQLENILTTEKAQQLLNN